LHWASTEASKHFHGAICGPSITGPPCGWFVIVMRAAAPPGMRAVTTLRPSFSPPSSPM
jgi:hypothetical protein